MKTTSLASVPLLLCLTTAVVAAQTYVSGPIAVSTSWTRQGSPYIVIGNVLVMQGVTLTVEPAVEVRFQRGLALQINGDLFAVGRPDSMITFTSDQTIPAPGDWARIFFSDASADAVYDLEGRYASGSIMQYSVVEYSSNALTMDSAHPFIDRCIIAHNAGSGIDAYNISSVLRITGNTISENVASGGGGISVSTNANSAITISHNTITDNESAGSGGGILASNPYIFYNAITIADNLIWNNRATDTGGGVYLRFTGQVSVTNNRISNNSSGGDGGGIFSQIFYSTPTTYSANLITGNTASSAGGGLFSSGAGAIRIESNVFGRNVASTGGALFIYAHSDGTVLVANNAIAENRSTGSGGGLSVSNTPRGTVTVSGNAIVRNIAEGGSPLAWECIGDAGSTTYNTIHGNEARGVGNPATVYLSGMFQFAYQNLYGNSATYELVNGTMAGSEYLNAGGTWWGTSVESEIQTKIFDFFDDFSKGVVEYLPYEVALRTDVPVSPPSGLVATPGIDEVVLQWTMNAEADIGGYRVYWGESPGRPYPNVVDVGNVTSYHLAVTESRSYYFSVTAYDLDYDASENDPNTVVNDCQTGGHESWYSMEAQGGLVPVAPFLEAEATSDGIAVTLTVPLAYSSIYARLFRRTGDGEWSCIAPWLRGEAGIVRHLDVDVEAGGIYEYEMEAFGPSGSIGRFGPVPAEMGLPSKLIVRLQSNPTSGATTVWFTLPKQGDGVLRVLDVRGLEVARNRLADSRPGVHRELLEPRDAYGRNLPSGMYFVQIDVPSGQQTVRWVVVR